MPDFSLLPKTVPAFCDLRWEEVEPYFADLLSRSLTSETIAGWLADWSSLTALVIECAARTNVATSINTADEDARAQRERFFKNLLQPADGFFEQYRERWVASGLAAPGYERQLERLQRMKSMYCPANQELEARVEQLQGNFWGITSAQMVTWQDRELQCGWGIQPTLRESSREDAERLWRLEADRRAADLDALRAIWTELFDLRCQMAANAGYASYLDFRWDQMGREFTPADCLAFHESIAQTVVPSASRVLAGRRDAMGLASLRPWDVPRDPPGKFPLRPFFNAVELMDGCSRIFHRIDPEFGNWFDRLRADGMLDLEARENKMGGGFSISYAVTRQTFISIHVNGDAREVFDLIHEVGHSLLALETRRRSFLQLFVASGEGGGEWTELTSQTAEMLALPYLGRSQGGFYREVEAARAEREFLQEKLLFLPSMALVDAFQHWAYTHPEQGRDPAQCERRWLELYDRFIPGEDWTGLEQERSTGWLTHGLIFSQPLFFIEYGIALMGALQIWRNARQDQPAAVARYRQALAQAGSGATIPELYEAAGARFAFDAQTLGALVGLVEERIRELG